MPVRLLTYVLWIGIGTLGAARVVGGAFQGQIQTGVTSVGETEQTGLRITVQVAVSVSTVEHGTEAHIYPSLEDSMGPDAIPWIPINGITADK